MAGISQQAGDVLGRAREGFVGMRFTTSTLDLIQTILNSDPQSVGVWTVTVDSASNDTDYTITVDGVSVTITSDGSATTTEISDALRDALNADFLIRGIAVSTASNPDVILTGLTPGAPFVVTAGALLTSVNTSPAAAADAVPFGRLVVDDGTQPTEMDSLGKLAQSTAFAAQVVTAVTIFVTAAIYTFTVRDETGAVLAQGSTDADTNTATTAAAIAVTMNGLLPAASVIVTNPSGGDIVFTSELAGREFSVEFGTNEEGQAGSALTSQTATTGPSPATSANRAARGVSIHSLNDNTTTIGGLEGEYGPNAGMRVLKTGTIWVENSEGISLGDPVFLELAAGDDAGKFFLADSATRVRLTGATWEQAAVTTADQIAVARVAF